MRLTLLAISLVLTACNTLPDTYESVDWSITSQSRYSVMLEFYSQDRNAAWPGGGQAYIIRDYDEHRYSLRCRSTEKICYGAWVENDPDQYWGAGMDDRFGCDNCCMICRDGNTKALTLHD